MDTAARMLSPSTVNHCINKVKGTILDSSKSSKSSKSITDYAQAARMLEPLCDEPFDPTYFRKTVEEDIKVLLGVSMVLLTIGMTHDALENFTRVQHTLEQIITENLLLSNRLLMRGNHPDAVGTFLSSLPDLVKYQISKCICTTL